MNDSLLVHPHIAEYVSSLVPDLPDRLAELESKAKQEEVPIIRKEAQGLLRFLLRTKRPKAILEIGAAVGFSASFMAYCTDYNTSIDTIEKVPARIEAVRKLLSENADLAEVITLLEGDAEEILKKLADEGRQYDFIFLDAAKAQYPAYLVQIRRLLAEGGILVTDNVLQEGSLAESKFTVTRRDRTIHMRMREYVRELFDDATFTSTLLPVGDGMTVSVREAKTEEV
ncbi:MAG: O-methyltransferase [Lachnospiraceae bacterium]|nr:O-methyltransferase [Lachnospiraceae bacterium]